MPYKDNWWRGMVENVVVINGTAVDCDTTFCDITTKTFQLYIQH